MTRDDQPASAWFALLLKHLRAGEEIGFIALQGESAIEAFAQMERDRASAAGRAFRLTDNQVRAWISGEFRRIIRGREA